MIQTSHDLANHIIEWSCPTRLLTVLQSCQSSLQRTRTQQLLLRTWWFVLTKPCLCTLSFGLLWRLVFFRYPRARVSQHSPGHLVHGSGQDNKSDESQQPGMQSMPYYYHLGEVQQSKTALRTHHPHYLHGKMVEQHEGGTHSPWRAHFKHDPNRLLKVHRDHEKGQSLYLPAIFSIHTAWNLLRSRPTALWTTISSPPRASAAARTVLSQASVKERSLSVSHNVHDKWICRGCNSLPE